MTDRELLLQIKKQQEIILQKVVSIEERLEVEGIGEGSLLGNYEKAKKRLEDHANEFASKVSKLNDNQKQLLYKKITELTGQKIE
mgnify:CR=1 FL=1